MKINESQTVTGMHFPERFSCIVQTKEWNELSYRSNGLTLLICANTLWNSAYIKRPLIF